MKDFVKIVHRSFFEARIYEIYVRINFRHDILDDSSVAAFCFLLICMSIQQIPEREQLTTKNRIQHTYAFARQKGGDLAPVLLTFVRYGKYFNLRSS